MTKFRVPPGGKITIGIEGDKPTAGKSSGASSGYIGTDPIDDQLYVLSKKGNITLYDLGVRENAHLALSSVDQTAESVEVYNAIMLSGDFLESLKLPQHSEYLYVDLVFRKDEEEDKRILIGAAGKRPYVKDFTDGSPPDPELVAQTDWTEGTAKLKASGAWHLAVDARFFYNSIDVKNTDIFKVTAGASTEEGIDFTVTSSDKLEIYLTPRMFHWNHNLSILGRLPVTPDFNAITPAPIFTLPAYIELTSGLIIGEPTPGYWQRVFEYFGDEFPGDTHFAMQEFQSWGIWASPGIVAIILKGGAPFYVWRMVPENAVAHALFHPVSLDA